RRGQAVAPVVLHVIARLAVLDGDVLAACPASVGLLVFPHSLFVILAGAPLGLLALFPVIAFGLLVLVAMAVVAVVVARFGHASGGEGHGGERGGEQQAFHGGDLSGSMEWSHPVGRRVNV